ncbi:nucleotide-binding protein [Paenibacillus sp. FSL H7-0942]|uniref:nucleotide-binding protein n=1 Tax=Paenibacillus sp. FSL H7-0942 TaxID=2921444 RepID=UPI00324E1AC3
MKQRLFIGSSIEGLRVAEALQELLQYTFLTNIWNQGNFNYNSATLDDLLTATKKYDFAIFVFSPDDITTLREQQVVTARDNVIFELGLFMGHLGRENVFFLLPEGVENLHIPSDLLGINTGKYHFVKNDDDLLGTLGPACRQIKKQISQGVDYDGISLAGTWHERWALEDTKSYCFTSINEDQNVEIKQKGEQIEANFIAGGKEYRLEGEIQGHFLTGKWNDLKRGLNYHGAFQLRIGINADTMSGLWIGFDSELNTIKKSIWEWKRAEISSYPSEKN